MSKAYSFVGKFSVEDDALDTSAFHLRRPFKRAFMSSVIEHGVYSGDIEPTKKKFK